MDITPLIVFLGPPGSGKGTQAQMLKDRLQCPYIATGDLVREILKSNAKSDSLYEQVRERYDNGVPQPDAIILELVERKLSNINLNRGVIFDAFPLSLAQAEGLERLCVKFSLPEPKVFYINVDKENVIRRLTQRKFCRACNKSFLPETESYVKNTCDICNISLSIRSDDTREVAAKRFDEYVSRLKDVIALYGKKGFLRIIQGEGAVNEVAQRIAAVL